jgi:Arylsulfotransferase (ASST)
VIVFPLVRALLAGSAALLGLGLASGCASASRRTVPGCVPSKLNISAALAGARVTVSPVPGARDASGATQISFLGVPAGALSNVVVTGSRSGAHAGRLLAYSQGDGASFVPARRFTAGELVTVRAELSEAGHTTPLAWSFTVAVSDTIHSARASTPPSAPRSGAFQSFVSRPDLRPPTVAVTTRSAAAAPGDLFIGPYAGPGQYGPMILDGSGRLLWFKPLAHQARAADFRVQQYGGREVLTWWQDPITIGGRPTAGLVIADSAYRTIAAMRAGNGYQPDLHEFQITPQGTALITIYNAIECNLSAAGGPREGALADSIMQEIDLRTGLVMFEWHSVDHVPLSDSYSSARTTSRTTPFDYFHINSIDVEHDGHLLIDARDTWAAYDVDPATGQVGWTLGGKRNSFKMGPGTLFAWQHDARQQPDGTISFFDNGATPRVHPQTRTLVIRLDMRRMTATLVRRYEHPTPIVSGSQGNMQALPNSDWLVGWGQSAYFSEFSASNQLLFDAHMSSGYTSYRAYRLAWHGQPADSPALAARRGAHGQIRVYASWNGATRVASWQVLEGSTAASLKPVAGAPRAGFETAIWAPGSGSYIAAQALDASGQVLGTSAPTALRVALGGR